MPSKKPRNEAARATLASLKKEMAKSRVAKSARKEYANLGSPLPMAKPRNRMDMEK